MMADSLKTFGGLTGDYCSYNLSKIVVLPVPFDLTSTWIKGADRGPEAIIEASANMELYDIETDSEVYLQGIHTADPVLEDSSKKMIEEVYSRVKSLLSDKKFVVSLGGEHSISIGAIKAHKEFFPNISVLHLDAHSDRRKTYLGDIFNHACVVSQIMESVDDVVSVGVRSMDSSEKEFIDESRVFLAHQIHESRGWVRDVVALLSDCVYVTIDLDVFDSGIMPSTGTPEPGGLSWHQVNTLLKETAKKKNIVGFDVVELAPNENNKAPDFLAAKLVYRLLSERFSR